MKFLPEDFRGQNQNLLGTSEWVISILTISGQYIHTIPVYSLSANPTLFLKNVVRAQLAEIPQTHFPNYCVTIGL